MAIQSNFPALRPTLNLDFLNSRITDPRITFTRASGGTYFNSAGVLTLAGNNAARFDYDPVTLAPKGLLVEESRTNSIRNNTMVGGSAGVAPTNWTASGSTGSGITVTVTGVGTEGGIAYVDYEINGTASITGTALAIGFDFTGIIAASAGQTWAWSSYLKLAAGTSDNLTFTPRIAWRDSGGAALSSTDGTSTPTSSGLAAQRFSFAATAPASTGFVIPQLRIGVVDGITYTGVRIRIGLPQLELGAFATSVIPTTTASATRAADVANMTGTNFSSWYNQSEGTLFVEFTPVAAYLNGRGAIGLYDGTSNNFMYIGSRNGSANYGANNRVAAGTIDTIGTFGATNTSTQKAAFAYANSNQGCTFNGAAVTTASLAVPTVNQMAIGAATTAVNSSAYIRSIRYYSKRLSNAELQALTS